MTVRPVRRAMFVVLGAASLSMVALLVGGIVNLGRQPTSSGPADSGEGPSTPKPLAFVMHESPQPLPVVGFEGEAGETLTLADFRGKTLLLNIWATWCVPCRKEMPTLDALQAELGGADFQVVPLSIDRAGQGVVREFFDEIGIQHLGLYIDASMQASFDLATVGLPTTLLIDAEGRELGRFIGPTEWDAPEMIARLASHVTPN